MQTIPDAMNWQDLTRPHPHTDPGTSQKDQWKRAFVRHMNDSLYAPLVNLLTRPLNWLYHRWQFIRPALFPAVVVAAVVIGFTTRQGRDVLVATAAGTPQHGAFFRLESFGLFVSLLIFSFTAWYFARLALDAAGHHCKREKAPRSYGLSRPFLAYHRSWRRRLSSSSTGRWRVVCTWRSDAEC